MRYLEAARDAGLRRAVVSSSANCRDVLVAAGIEDLFEVRIDGVVAERERAAGQAGARTPSSPARRARTSAPTQAAVFEDALAGVEAGRAGGFGCVVGVDRVGQADALREHGADIVVAGPRRAAGGPHDPAPRLPVEPWAVRETELDLDVLAQTESVFALSNGHIGLRGNLDEGEPHGLPGTYLNGFYETAPAAVRGGRATATPRPARRSSTSPTARSSGCSSTTSPSTCATASCARTSACSTCAPGCCDAAGRVGLPGRAGGARAHRRGWSRSPSGRSPRSSTRSSRWTRRRGRRPVRAGGQRAAAAAVQDDPRAGAGAGLGRCESEDVLRPRHPACVLVHSHRARAACGWPRPWTTSSTGRRARETSRRERRRTSAG